MKEGTMTIYREVVVTREERDALTDLASQLTRLAIVERIPLGRYAAAVHDVIERWDEAVASESTFPIEHDLLERHIDEIVGVL